MQRALLIAALGTMVTVLVFVLTALALRLPRIDDRFEHIVDRYHDALAWLLDRRLVPILLCGAALAVVVVAQRNSASVVLVADTASPTQSPGGTQTAVRDDQYLRATGRSRLIQLDVRGPDRQTVSGVARRISDDVRRVPGASGVRVFKEPPSEVQGQTPNNGDREHIARVEAVVVGRARSNVLADIRRALEATPPPPGYQVSDGTRTVGGTNTVALTGLTLGAILLIAVVLASQSRIVAESMTIVVALLITIAGVVGALRTSGHAISLLGIAGGLIVMGVALRDTVLLLNDARRRHARGVAERIALIEAARYRVRPALTVAFALAMGALPLALATPAVVGSYSSLGVAILAGAVTAAIATLFVTPPLRLALSDVARRRRARRIEVRVG